MKILHISDFHYSSQLKHQYQQNNIVDALVKDLSNDEKIDYLFFTGDLVFSGERVEDFVEAKKLLLDRLSNDLKIDKNKIFICGGNHDVFRNQELVDTTDKIKEINNNEKLEEFLKRQEGKSFKESLKNISHYNEFQKKFYNEYSNGNKQIISDLYTIHKQSHGNNKIGILTINTGWRSIDSKFDRGNLLFPISILKTAIEELRKDTEFRIILMHHPISDLKDWNSSDIEDLIYKEFHLLFSGHLHKKKQNIQITTDEGIFCCSASATLSLDESRNGYTLINIDVETYDIEFENVSYNIQDNIFLHPKEKSKTSIPVGDSKQASITFKKTLRKKYLEELERANELFISYDGKESSKGFNDLYTEPILKNKTKAVIAETKQESSNTNVSQIITTKDDIVIFGKDKSGKTSVLYKIFLDLFVDFAVHKTIPIFIDAKEYKISGKQFDIYKIIIKYYEINQAKAQSLLEKYSVRLLIDNYDPNFSTFNEVVSEFLRKNISVCFIVAMEEKIGASFVPYEFDGRKYTKLYIHEISRPEVRQLTNKWPNITEDKRELILDKIYGIFTQLNIPTNYWTVSLFLWIFEKNNEADFHNSFELIQLYIDNLLDRKRLALDKSSKLKFEDFKSYLSELAHFLMIDRADKGYTATYSEIVIFTNSYRDKNKRFVIEVEDVIHLIIEKHVLRKVFDDSYTFRLNGVYEYFIGLYMSKDQNFANQVINDDHYYLSFGNEIELYAGFEKKSSREYLERILNRTKEIFKPLNDQYSQVNIDSQLKMKISEVFDISLPMQKLSSDFKRSFGVEKQDEILSELHPSKNQKSEVKVKEYYEKIEGNSENLEKALHILARVFRNSNIEDEKQLDEVLEYILDSACQLGFKLIDEAETKGFGLKTEELGDKREKILVKFLTNFMPLIVQTFLYDSIAQNDLERIFKEKIEELKKDKKNNQFKLMLLYFTLIDLNVKAHKDLIPEVIENITLNLLRQTTIIKLYYYLMFKCNNQPHFESFLKEQIRIQTLKINSKTDIGNLQKGIEKAARMSHSRRKK
jgi:predicted MPP superfamily phosphohydrolase